MKTLLVTLILCTSLPLFAADPKPTADVLGRWVGGTWPLEGKMLDSDYSKAMIVTGVSTCAWSPDHIFVVCDQSLVADGKPSRDLSVFAFDAENGTYHFFGLSPGGSRPRTGDVNITADGTRWEYLTKTTIKDKPVWFRTINQFKGNDQVDWWSEYSTDEGQHWTRTGGGLEKRQK